MNYTSKKAVEASVAADKAASAQESDAAAEAAEKATETGTLVKMFKDGAFTDVHPSTVSSHMNAGWKVSQ